MSILSQISAASSMSVTCNTAQTVRESYGRKRKRSKISKELKTWKKANEYASKAACELMLPNGVSVMGTLVEKQKERSFEYLFISTNKLLPVNSPDDLCNAKLLFHDLKKKGCVPLSSQKVRNVWNTRLRGTHPGNTVVELNDEIAEEVRKRGADFIRVGNARPGTEVRKFVL